MNPQQIPGELDKTGAFHQLNGKDIRWTDPAGLTHFCAGADVHPGIRLIWTFCERDVPAGKAWLRQEESKTSYEVCALCLHRSNELEKLRKGL